MGVHVGRDAIGNVIVAGSGNKIDAQVTVTQAPPVDAAAVDIAKELAAIRAVLAGLGSEHGGKIGRALDDADEEANKHARADKQQLGDALDRALKLAKSSSAFAGEIGKLLPHVHAAAAWLGGAWSALLAHLA